MRGAHQPSSHLSGKKKWHGMTFMVMMTLMVSLGLKTDEKIPVPTHTVFYI
jgi:hypothetical protein